MKFVVTSLIAVAVASAALSAYAAPLPSQPTVTTIGTIQTPPVPPLTISELLQNATPSEIDQLSKAAGLATSQSPPAQGTAAPPPSRIARRKYNPPDGPVEDKVPPSDLKLLGSVAGNVIGDLNRSSVPRRNIGAVAADDPGHLVGNPLGGLSSVSGREDGAVVADNSDRRVSLGNLKPLGSVAGNVIGHLNLSSIFRREDGAEVADNSDRRVSPGDLKPLGSVSGNVIGHLNLSSIFRREDGAEVAANSDFQIVPDDPSRFVGNLPIVHPSGDRKPFRHIIGDAPRVNLSSIFRRDSDIFVLV